MNKVKRFGTNEDYGSSSTPTRNWVFEYVFFGDENSLKMAQMKKITVDKHRKTRGNEGRKRKKWVKNYNERN